MFHYATRGAKEMGYICSLVCAIIYNILVHCGVSVSSDCSVSGLLYEQGLYAGVDGVGSHSLPVLARLLGAHPISLQALQQRQRQETYVTHTNTYTAVVVVAGIVVVVVVVVGGGGGGGGG